MQNNFITKFDILRENCIIEWHLREIYKTIDLELAKTMTFLQKEKMSPVAWQTEKFFLGHSVQWDGVRKHF